MAALSSDISSAVLGAADAVTFGVMPLEAGANRHAHVNLPWLAGLKEEQLFANSALQVRVWRAAVAGPELEEVTRRIYDALLADVGSANLVRVWNYVPQINRVEEGLERYRAFSRGRAQAFEAAWGTHFEGRLPAAAGVGGSPDELVVIAAWGEGRAVAWENPVQMPAYRYPAEYGPRSPSFARATHFLDGRDEWFFISGTAAVRGHASVAVGDLAGQIDCTMDNLRLIGAQGGIGAEVGADGGWIRTFKVYLRNPADLARAQSLLAGHAEFDATRALWVQSDICRSDLLIEIEVTLRRARRD